MTNDFCFVFLPFGLGISKSNYSRGDCDVRCADVNYKNIFAREAFSFSFFFHLITSQFLFWERLCITTYVLEFFFSYMGT